MGIEICLLIGAVVCAATLGFLGVELLQKVLWRDRRTRDVLGGSGKGRIAAKLYEASRIFEKPANWLLRFSGVSEAAWGAKFAYGCDWLLDDATKNVSALLFLGCGGAILGVVLSQAPVFGLAIFCLVVFGGITFTKNRIDGANLAMREQVPEAIRCIGTCFGSGYSLLQTMRNTQVEVGGNLGRLFGICANRLEMGESSKEALRAIGENSKVPELMFVAVALDVQHVCGGSVAGVLESAKDSVESGLELARNLKVQTAQAKLSSNIVTLMPFILLAIFSFVSPGFLSPFFESALGVLMLCIAVAMQAAGVFSVRRMLRVDGV